MIFGEQGYSSASWMSQSDFGQIIKSSTDSLILQLAEARQQNVLQYQIASDSLSIKIGEDIKSLFRGEGQGVVRVKADNTILQIEADTIIVVCRGGREEE